MPEGDTIFRAATALRKALQGARVTQFRSAKLGRGPVGERIEEVTARGKNLLLRFEKGRSATGPLDRGAPETPSAPCASGCMAAPGSHVSSASRPSW